MISEPLQILVVDDDAALLAVLEAGLRLHAEYAITATGRAAEALRLIETHHFDIVVTDFQLGDPLINGLSVLKAARHYSQRTMVIIITAYASLEVTLEAIHWGACNFLTKPFQLDELKLVVRNAAERVVLERENAGLRREAESLVAALDDLQRQQGELTERLRQLTADNGAAQRAGAPAVLGALDPEVGALRRRMSEQLAASLRMSEIIRERLTRKRQEIERVIRPGASLRQTPGPAASAAIRPGLS